jgi:hypothetical protein
VKSRRGRGGGGGYGDVRSATTTMG